MTCGVEGAGDCCESALIPAGTFYRDHDVGQDGEYPSLAHPASVSDFRLDLYEVTVGRFRIFVDSGRSSLPAAGEGAHEHLAASGWDEAWNAALAADRTSLSAALICDPAQATWTDRPGPNEDLPITCVTWYEAMAFCVADGGYLPTDVEWTYAAAGGEQHRAFPWSSPPGMLSITCEQATYFDGGLTCGKPTAVGTKPAGTGRWGQADLTGNAAEWVLDWYTGFLEPKYIDPCADCGHVSQDPDWEVRSTRGGAFNDIPFRVRPADWRAGIGPLSRSVELGFRCGRPTL